MRIFSKIVFLCNVCFLITAILRLINMSSDKKDAGEALIFQPLVSTLVILGYGAIILNIVFNIIGLIFFLLKKPQLVAQWLIWVNFLFLLVQICYFFF